MLSFLIFDLHAKQGQKIETFVEFFALFGLELKISAKMRKRNI